MRVATPVALFILLISVSDAFACSCRMLSAQELIERSESIFTGTAQGTERPEEGPAQTSFRVVTGYKGVKGGETVTVHHDAGPSSRCGIRFEKGESYTLRAYRNKETDRLTTGLCGVRVMETPGGEEALKILSPDIEAQAQPPFKPLTPPLPPPTTDRIHFDRPILQGALVDHCESWATNCGAGGAQAFCRFLGFARALEWNTERPGRTWVIGSNRYCDGSPCQGFSFIICER